ncbi:MAG: hypothetical protein L0Z07_07320 [Planctomycetes bacterium]|nr:hypothetical protein [Planctomycetota bacterium]
MSTSESRRLKILITEGSSISARQAIYDLGPRHTIDILDPSRLCQCRFSRFVRHWYPSPSFTEDPCGYLSFLGQRLSAEPYDVLLPLHDEVFLLSRVRDELAQRVAVAIPDFAALEVLQSKIRCHALLNELAIPQPPADVVADQGDLDRWADFPRYVKADYGTAGQAVRLVHDQRELQTALACFQQRGWWQSGAPLLLQQPATGSQGFVRAVFRHGELVAQHATVLRLGGVGGAAVAKVGVNHPAVAEHMRRLGERLAWHGVLFCDYFYDEATHEPRYIEANPRIGDSANAAFSGVNLCERWVDVALQRTAPPFSMAAPGERSHAVLLILMSKALEGSGRRELWNELRRWQQGTGIYDYSRDELTRPHDDWLSVLPLAWIAGRLLARPAAAHRVVQSTVANYALNSGAAQRIRMMPRETLVACLDAESHPVNR